jgi:ribosomal protein L29
MEAIKELKAEVDALRGELATLRASAPRPGAKAPSAALKIKRKTAKPG